MNRRVSSRQPQPLGVHQLLGAIARKEHLDQPINVRLLQHSAVKPDQVAIAELNLVASPRRQNLVVIKNLLKKYHLHL